VLAALGVIVKKSTLVITTASVFVTFGILLSISISISAYDEARSLSYDIEDIRSQAERNADDINDIEQDLRFRQ